MQSVAVCPEELISLGHKLADASAAVIKKHFRTKVGIDSKLDESPVTVADRDAEAAMREILSKDVPDHCVYGEEQGMEASSSGSEYLWVLDPIDGTRSFITGNPLFGTLISLLHKGKPILGIINVPILGERWVGAAGQKSTMNGNEISCRPCEDVRAAYMYSTSPQIFQGLSEEAYNPLRDQVKRALYGGDCYSYGLLASGYCDLVVEATMGPYDYLAHVPIIQGAGGVITDWEGNDLTWQMTPSKTYAIQNLPGEIVAAGDKATHKQAIEILDWNKRQEREESAGVVDTTYHS